jgi:hypothetical protein
MSENNQSHKSIAREGLTGGSVFAAKIFVILGWSSRIESTDVGIIWLEI